MESCKRTVRGLMWTSGLLISYGLHLNKVEASVLHGAECLWSPAGILHSEESKACPLPIDEHVGPQPASWAPWTHRPYCVNSTVNTVAKFCVYTNSGHGENGISIITTPEIAAASVDELGDSHTDMVSSDPPYEVVDIPNKGYGVLATRLIPKYSTFMWDYAAVLADVTFPRSVKQFQGYQLLHHAADQLIDPNTVLTLARSNPARLSDVVEDVMRTNSFRSDLAGAPHMALFPLISRINHACKPNSFMRFTPKSFSASVVAFRDIHPGEEISISYISLGLTHKERQDTLSGWGFKCACELCNAAPEEVEASDDRRAKVLSLKDDVVKALGRGKVYKAIKLTHDAIELLEMEGLVPMLTEQYETLARTYYAMNDREKAEEYGAKAIEILAMHGFLDSGDHDYHLQNLLKAFERGAT